MLVALAEPSEAAIDRPHAELADGTAGLSQDSSVTVYWIDGDNVHDPSQGDASGHGWWKKISGPGKRANVTITLQSLVRTSSTTWGWQHQASNNKIVYPGGGSARWVHARKACYAETRTQWRSFIEVDVLGEVDVPRRAFTPEVYLYCSPN